MTTGAGACELRSVKDPMLVGRLSVTVKCCSSVCMTLYGLSKRGNNLVDCDVLPLYAYRQWAAVVDSSMRSPFLKRKVVVCFQLAVWACVIFDVRRLFMASISMGCMLSMMVQAMAVVDSLSHLSVYYGRGDMGVEYWQGMKLLSKQYLFSHWKIDHLILQFSLKIAKHWCRLWWQIKLGKDLWEATQKGGWMGKGADVGVYRKGGGSGCLWYTYLTLNPMSLTRLMRCEAEGTQ